MKTAIVYDRVNKWGGAERVLLALHKIFPEAPLYTSVYDEKRASWAKAFPKVYTSFLQKIPFAKNNHELFAPLMPIAFEQFNFDEYDLVISVTSEAAKGIITKPHTFHLCYMLTPTRYLWSHYTTYLKGVTLKVLASPVIKYLRNWDKIAATRPDKIIAISTEVKKRIKKYYNRDSEIIFPPADSLASYHKNRLLRVSSKTSRRFLLDTQPYYLYVGRLVGYKKVDLLVNTFNDLNKKLVIVGTGYEVNSLKSKSRNNIKFLGEIDESELKRIYLKAKALIMPQEEDFGIVAVEAQSFGVPVIAYKKGGACDTVIDGVTGVLFDEQNEASLTSAIEKFDKMSFNRRALIDNAKKFSFEIFQKKLQRSLVRTFGGRRWRNKTLASFKK